ncbi:MAG: acetamidase/formamidase family protein [Dehalococcoidia bacterium]
MKSIEIDRTKSLIEEPEKGHNRFHPEIRPVLEVEEGEEMVFETRTSMDNQFTPATTAADFASMDSLRVHPLTGPVYVRGAQPGDLLEVEFLAIETGRWAYTGVMPGRGYLRDTMDKGLLAHWDLADGWATSAQVPGVRIPSAPFMGIAAVAPSHELLRTWNRREAATAASGGLAQPPNAKSAVPGGGPVAEEAARTIPPRENGGNMDIKQSTVGSKLLLPVFTDGALFSTGDGHFAQGDGEVCIHAVETDCTVSVRFRVLKGEAERRGIRAPRLQHESYEPAAGFAGPRRFTATVGLSLREDGSNPSEDLNSACRHALLQMIDVLQERGYTREQAYIICSVAVDLKISQIVDAPNMTVTAVLPEEIFHS